MYPGKPEVSNARAHVHAGGAAPGAANIQLRNYNAAFFHAFDQSESRRETHAYVGHESDWSNRNIRFWNDVAKSALQFPKADENSDQSDSLVVSHVRIC